MTLDEAIERYTSNAEYERTHGSLQGCMDFKQLAEWLKDYKRLLEREPSDDAISRQATLGCCRNEWEEEVEIRLKSLPSVTPQQSCEDIAKAFQFGMALGFGEKHDEMDKIMEEFKKVITPEPKWIPVSDSLPKKDDLYLICFDNGEYELSYFYKDSFSYSGVIAWMPLPDPYKAESEAKG